MTECMSKHDWTECMKLNSGATFTCGASWWPFCVRQCLQFLLLNAAVSTEMNWDSMLEITVQVQYRTTVEALHAGTRPCSSLITRNNIGHCISIQQHEEPCSSSCFSLTVCTALFHTSSLFINVSLSLPLSLSSSSPPSLPPSLSLLFLPCAAGV